MKRLLGLLAILFVGLSAAPRLTDACSPAADFYVKDTIGEDGLSDVPAAGIVVIFMMVSDSASLNVSVTDSDGVAVPGAHEVRGDRWGGSWGSVLDGRMIWRSEAPLAPDARYEMTISAESGVGNAPPVTIPFTTRSTDAPSSPGFTITETLLAENILAADQVCCSEVVDSCGVTAGEDCWATASETLYYLSARLAYPPEEGRYAELDVSLDGGPDVMARSDASSASVGADISRLGALHCLTITMTSLIDGRSQAQTTCATSSEVVRNTPPELYPADVCNDPHRGENDVVSEPSGGCSAGAASPGCTGLAGGLVLLLVARRRRRHVGLMR